MKLVLLVLFLMAACERASGTPPPKPSAKQMTQSDVDLQWTLKKSADGKRLLIDYTLRNTSPHKIFVADQLLAYHAGKIQLVPERVIVASDNQPGVVRFVRGIVETDTTQFDHPPGASAVEAGAVHKGSASLELPLEGWHNYATPPEIPKKPKSAVLEIAYLSGELSWGLVKTSDGLEVKIPQMASYNTGAKLARSDVKPLP